MSLKDGLNAPIISICSENVARHEPRQDPVKYNNKTFYPRFKENTRSTRKGTVMIPPLVY